MAADSATALKTAAQTEKDEATTDTKKVARVQGPRPCYVLLNEPLPEGIHIVSATRRAEEALQAIDKGEANAYLRIMVK